jgi:cation diffusion facilitator CzcD-associated flavoprotein CzcO
MASHVERPYHVAIVGSGPWGFFAAASLRLLHVQPVCQQCFEAARTVVPQRKPTGQAYCRASLPIHGMALNITLDGYADALNFGFVGRSETPPPPAKARHPYRRRPRST